ncbi:phage integrase family protein [Pseudoduganella lurida]|uniref:Phage integrase family protein n=1 Tax=Pseudoduganella lurida TaxID=1036180 RepID=A0A562RJ97_9BURK|nr:tyrosine-type recombinase/integrase [Pseudoduganella lurida]TWI69013.1 phage integrase family protein [Pseudoduganella lurida]
MNRTRKTNRGLPRRVYVNHGAYFFVPSEPTIDPRKKKAGPKKWIKLCTVDDGEAAMLAALATILGNPVNAEGTMPWCCSEFKSRMLREYTPKTAGVYSSYLETIAEVFAEFHATQVTTKDWADFLRAKYADKANTAKKLTALAGKLFRFIIGDLGLRQDNPIDQLDMSGYRTRARTVLAGHEQVAAIREAALVGSHGKQTPNGPMFVCLVDMAYLCWQRAQDIRTLQESQIHPSPAGLVGGHVAFIPSKTKLTSGMAVDVTITPAIARVIERARAEKRRRQVVSSYLFPATTNKNVGHPFLKGSLVEMWERARDRAVEKAKAEGREFGPLITFRDLRALGATDAAASGEEHAEIQKRLAHTSGKTTNIYIKRVIPKVSALDTQLPWGNDAAEE